MLTVSAGEEEIDVPVVEDFVVAIRIEEGRIIVSDLEDLPRNAIAGPEGRRDG